MPMSDRLTEVHKEALWKWRWLGVKNGTPAFRVSLLVFGVAACGIAAVAVFAYT